MDDKHRVLAANHAFYAAYRFADLDAMERTWTTDPEAAELSRNNHTVSGREAVMDFWRNRLNSNTVPEIQPRETTVIRGRNSAMVFCLEDTGGTRRSASNLFTNDAGEWRLVRHQSMRLERV